MVSLVLCNATQALSWKFLFPRKICKYEVINEWYCKTNSIAGRGLKSQMLCTSLHYCLSVMANSTSSFVFLLYRHVSAWSNAYNVLVTFLMPLSIHISVVKYPKQNKWFDKWWSHQLSMLHFTFPSGKTLLHDAFCFWHPFLQFLNKKTHLISLKNQQNSCWTLSINSNNHAYLVSQSTLFTQSEINH